MRFLLLTTAFLIALGLTPPSGAQDQPPLDAARALFAEGNYLEAAEAAHAVGTAEALALATQMTCHYGRFVAPEEERLALFEKAVAWAEAALAMAPDDSFVRAQNAHALGRYAQQFGVVEAISEGFASRIREHIDAALALDPENAGAHALLAGWHAEILDSAGFFGGLIYGADEDEVFTHFAETVRLSPNDPLLHLEYALGVLKLDDEENQGLARKQLAWVIAHEPQTALEHVLLDQARTVMAGLDQETADR